jgi:hypothetical protein
LSMHSVTKKKQTEQEVSHYFHLDYKCKKYGEIKNPAWKRG